ncbi:MAG: synthase [Thermacetogenium sp.]|uniref:NH(3)-dependent NAD(+) synthetase n=1 Tax=Thermacetogenium phaeum TaxID=85874 RepID=A0A101FGP8_9THEO|nr:MAG: NH(3)-dependent NAD(+) synthetase [Thermacetogenium phaeum]MDN5366143.1 synthase [Thermacetogenium sp.]
MRKPPHFAKISNGVFIMPEKMHPVELAESLVEWIRRRVVEAGAVGVVYGLSGGLDSAVVGALCRRAFPATSLALVMPCHSLDLDIQDARLIADALDLRMKVVVLDRVYERLLGLLEPVAAECPEERALLARANIKPRLRMIVLYYYASIYNYLVVGSSNKSELTVGYFTKYGDGGSDLVPLGNLAKCQVRELAAYLNVPERIIAKPPSAGLWENQTDEEEMGFSYEVLDSYVLGGEVPPLLKEKIEGMKRRSEHKRRMPPIPDF